MPLAALVAILLGAPVASAGKHGGKHDNPPRSSTSQLRGAMITPNYSARGTPFAMTGSQQHAELQNVCSMGGNLIRFQVDWSQLQPSDYDPGYLARMDQVMSWAAACHMEVILDLVGSPCWSIQPAICRGSTWIFAPPRPGTFGAVTRFLLTRYPGMFAIEVWNEPNGTFWTGTPGDYAAIVNEAVAARNAVGSRTKVLAGALLMDGFSYLQASSYLEALYQVGMRGQDGISIHPYSMGCLYVYVCGVFVNPVRRGSPFQVAIRLTHGVMLRYGDPGGIYLTEFGFATCPAQPACVPEETAARWLARSFQVAAAYPYVEGLTVFSMRDFADPSDQNPHWDLRTGILRKDLSPKPAFGLVKSVLSRLAAGHRARKRDRHRGKRERHRGRRRQSSNSA